MAKTIVGVVASLLLFVAPAAAEERPAAPPPPANAEALAHRAMQDAMLKHATPPPDVPRMPEHAAVHAGAGQTGAQAHHQVAEHLAQRHAAMDRERRAQGAGHPAARGANGSAAGMMNGHGGAGAEGGVGSCDNPAGPVRTMERHGGSDGTGGGDHTGAPGSGPAPHGGQTDGMR